MGIIYSFLNWFTKQKFRAETVLRGCGREMVETASRGRGGGGV